MPSYEFYVDKSGRVDGHYNDEGKIVQTPEDAKSSKEVIDLDDKNILGVVDLGKTPHVINGKTEIHHVRALVMNDKSWIALMLPTKPLEEEPAAIKALDRMTSQLTTTPSQQARSAAALGEAILGADAVVAKFAPAFRV